MLKHLRYTLNFLFIFALLNGTQCSANSDLPLYYWQQPHFVNFGDFLSVKVVERMINGPVRIYKKKPNFHEKKLLAIGSILFFANNNDVIWGSGINGKKLDKSDYSFSNLDVRAIRGPLSRQFLYDNFQIECPEIYGDPALLIPYLFPEFKKAENPSYDYIIVVHYSDIPEFPRSENSHIVYATDPWDTVIEKILDSKFVISSSLHGVIVAEAFGIPAKLLRISDTEPPFKFIDYYAGTGRDNFQFASSVEEALEMGGEPPFVCDLEALYYSFPFEFWPEASFTLPNFNAE
jgi:pyruvyltransferase